MLRGGEMGEHIRNYPWETTSVGNPDQWPQSLLTTLSIILNSKFPMFLFWGRDLICFYNDAYRPSLGNEGKHPWALGKSAREVWPEIWSDIQPIIDQVLNGWEANWSEDQLLPIYRNGRLEDVYWTFSYSPVAGESGEAAGVFVTCTETTEKMETLRKLKLSVEEQVEARKKIEAAERRSRLSIEAGELGTYEINLVTNEIITSPRFDAIFGNRHTSDHEQYVTTIVEDDLPVRNAAFNNAMKSGTLDYEVRIRWGDGSLHWVRVKGNVGFDKDGRAVNLLGVVQDITDRMEFAEKLSKQVKERTRELEIAQSLLVAANDYLQNIINEFEAALACLIPVYEGGKIVDFYFKMSNDAYTKYSGTPPGLIKHKRVSEIFPGYFQTEAFPRYVETFESGKQNSWDLHYDVDGLDVYLRMVANKMGEEVVVNFTDITALKQLQMELLQKIKELEQSNNDLQQFAHVASHDLKEPVRKIRVFGSRMKYEFQQLLPPQARFYLDKIDRAADRMYAMIDGVLLYSSSDAETPLDEAVDLNNTIRNIEADLELLIQQKSASIHYHALPVVEGAPLLLYQLFYNLILNSLKFSHSSRTPVIYINASVFGDQVQIVVSDNGIGFGQNESRNIFKTFTRLHAKDRYEGTGLGLALCQKIVERHGGSISAEGVEGEGAVFKIVLKRK